MKTSLLICLSLFSCFVFAENPPIKCEGADLAILEILPPEWDNDNRQTVITIVIKNEGRMASAPCTFRVFDLDISADDSLLNPADSLELQLVEENNARARYYVQDSTMSVDDFRYDYDDYWEFNEQIESLKPGEKRTLTFYLKDLWIYDSNCEIRAVIIEEKLTEDCDRTNNILDFLAWG